MTAWASIYQASTIYSASGRLQFKAWRRSPRPLFKTRRLLNGDIILARPLFETWMFQQIVFKSIEGGILARCLPGLELSTSSCKPAFCWLVPVIEENEGELRISWHNSQDRSIISFAGVNERIVPYMGLWKRFVRFIWSFLKNSEKGHQILKHRTHPKYWAKYTTHSPWCIC